MIVLNVTYSCKPGMREAFLESVAEQGIDLASRAEEGNIKYDYYKSVENEDELFLVEKWKDANALAIHYCQPHFIMLGDIKEEFVADTEIDKYQVGESD